MSPSFRWAAVALVVAAAAVLSCLPLLLSPTLPRGDDVGEHVQFVQDFAAGLREGVPYPRWLPRANRGYGAPAFVFYPPLATALVAGMHAAGLDLFTAFRLGFLLLTLAAGAAGAALGYRLGGAAAAAVVGSLWVLLPYHAVDVYSRFALAETATFVFLPLVFLALESHGRRSLAGAAAAFAGLCLSHLPTAFLAAWAALVWSLARHGRRRAAATLGALALGAACAAVYLIPALAERPLVHADWLESNPVYRFDAHYLVFPRDLPAPSAPASDETATIEVDHRLGPTPGRVRVAVATTLALALAGWLTGRWLQPAPGDRLHRYLVLALAGAAGMTRLSDPVWRYVPGFAAVVFPWRLTLLLTLAAAVLLGVTAAGLLPRRPGAAALLISGALATAVGTSAWAARGADWQTFTPEHARRPVVVLRVAGAFMPRGNPDMRGFRRRAAAGAADVRDPAGNPAGRIEPVRPDGLRRRYRVWVDTNGPARLHVPQFDYPGWLARVDGHPAAIEPQPPLGTLGVPVPPGRHDVEVRFGSTPLRRGSAVLSLAAAVLLLALTLPGGDRTMADGGSAP